MHDIEKEWKVSRRISLVFSMRDGRAFWGRFGGGWQYKLGIQATRDLHCVIVSLLFFSIRYTRYPEIRES